MRVLHVLPTRDLAYGGPVVVVREIVRESRKQGIEADAFPDERTYARRWPLYHPGIVPLAQLIRRARDYDLIHVHGLWYAAAAVAAWVARKHSIPYVITPHGMLDEWALSRSRLKKRAYLALIERRNLRGAASIHFLNQSEYEASKKTLDGMACFVLPNGVDVDAYANLPSPSELTSLYPELAGKLVLLFLGRINFKKGLDVLITAFEHARKTDNSLHLIIAGPDDGYLHHVLQLVTHARLEDHVTLTGMISGYRKLQVLAASRLFLLMSRQEGDSLALKEALAAGVPVLISRACNFPEAEQHECGVVVPDNPAAVAQAILRLTKDTKSLVCMAERGRSLIRSQYAWNNIVARLIREYRSIAAYRGS